MTGLGFGIAVFCFTNMNGKNFELKYLMNKLIQKKELKTSINVLHYKLKGNSI
jgi:hypothetical protein